MGPCIGPRHVSLAYSGSPTTSCSLPYCCSFIKDLIAKTPSHVVWVSLMSASVFFRADVKVAKPIQPHGVAAGVHRQRHGHAVGQSYGGASERCAVCQFIY
jgi:hypothetical protein